MKFKIYKNQVIGTLCYNYYDIVNYSLKNENNWPFQNIERVLYLLAKENGLTCYYYNDFVDNSFFIALYGSITNMLRFRSSIKYLFSFKEKNDWFGIDKED